MQYIYISLSPDLLSIFLICSQLSHNFSIFQNFKLTNEVHHQYLWSIFLIHSQLSHKSTIFNVSNLLMRLNIRAHYLLRFNITANYLFKKQNSTRDRFFSKSSGNSFDLQLAPPSFKVNVKLINKVHHQLQPTFHFKPANEIHHLINKLKNMNIKKLISTTNISNLSSPY